MLTNIFSSDSKGICCASDSWNGLIFVIRGKLGLLVSQHLHKYRGQFYHLVCFSATSSRDLLLFMIREGIFCTVRIYICIILVPMRSSNVCCQVWNAITTIFWGQYICSVLAFIVGHYRNSFLFVDISTYNLYRLTSLTWFPVY